MAAVALMLSVCLNARREVTNVQPIYLLSTVLLNLGIESLLAIVYALVAVPWLRWLLREYQVERVWRVVSPIPAICIAFIIFIMPQDPATVLVNRMQRVSIVALLMAMMAMLLLLYQFYRMAQESVRNLTLIQETRCWNWNRAAMHNCGSTWHKLAASATIFGSTCTLLPG